MLALYIKGLLDITNIIDLRTNLGSSFAFYLVIFIYNLLVNRIFINISYLNILVKA